MVAGVGDSGGQHADFMHMPHIPAGIVTLTLVVPLHPTFGLKPTNRQVPILSRPTSTGRRLGATTSGIAAGNCTVGHRSPCPPPSYRMGWYLTDFFFPGTYLCPAGHSHDKTTRVQDNGTSDAKTTARARQLSKFTPRRGFNYGSPNSTPRTAPRPRLISQLLNPHQASAGSLSLRCRKHASSLHKMRIPWLATDMNARARLPCPLGPLEPPSQLPVPGIT